MSNTTSSNTSTPSGVTTAVDLSSSLSILLLGTAGSSFLIPISMALLYFSKPRAKRQPMFLMILSSLVLGLGEGGLNIYNQVQTIMKKSVPQGVTTAYTFVHLFLPMFSEGVLLFRVGCIFPPRGISWYKRLLVYGPMAVLKIARLVVLVAIAVDWISKAQGLPAPVQGGLDALTAINKLPTQVKWALQSADTLFMSFLFFPRMTNKKKPKRAAKPSDTPDAHAEHDEDEPSLFARLKVLFWDAVSSFVFPVLLNLVQFVLVLCQNGVLKFPSLFAVNNQAGIIGMVFATVWQPSGASDKSASPPTTTTTTSTTAGGARPRVGRGDSATSQVSTLSMSGASVKSAAQRQRARAQPSTKEGSQPAPVRPKATQYDTNATLTDGPRPAAPQRSPSSKSGESDEKTGAVATVEEVGLGAFGVGLGGFGGVLAGGAFGGLGGTPGILASLGLGDITGDVTNGVRDLEAGLDDVEGKVGDAVETEVISVKDRVLDEGAHLQDEATSRVSDVESGIREEVRGGLGDAGSEIGHHLAE